MRAIQLVEIGRPLQRRNVPVAPVGEKEISVRIKAAGICHSDVHYRDGVSAVGPLPQTLGHEIAGVVEQVGPQVAGLAVGNRVCLHYLLTCGDCAYCTAGHEQFCPHGQMLGKHTDGGYAEYIVVPARSAVLLPEEIPFEHGAIMMCSSATSLHALRKARLAAGETVAVYGAGGLGMSAIQLARAFGATDVYAVDIDKAKLDVAESYGAIPVYAVETDPAAEIRHLTGGKGVDVSLEVIGLKETMEQAVRCLAVMGRAVLAGIAERPFEIDSYPELLAREVEVIGSSDHLLQEMPLLIELTRRGSLDLSRVVTQTVPLEAGPINDVMDALARFDSAVRTVITP